MRCPLAVCWCVRRLFAAIRGFGAKFSKVVWLATKRDCLHLLEPPYLPTTSASVCKVIPLRQFGSLCCSWLCSVQTISVFAPFWAKQRIIWSLLRLTRAFYVPQGCHIIHLGMLNDSSSYDADCGWCIVCLTLLNCVLFPFASVQRRTNYAI